MQKGRRETTHKLLLGLAAMALMAGFAQAELITIEIEAVVDSVQDDGPGDGYLDGLIGSGDTITGFYKYESTTPDSNPSDYVGDYEHFSPPYGMFLNVSGFDFQTNPPDTDFVIEVIDNDSSEGLHDSFILISYNNSPLSNGSTVDDISWFLRDYTATAVPDDSLLLSAPVLDDWQSGIGLRLTGERGDYRIRATVTSAVQVPEPGTILLVVALGLFGLRRRAA